MIRTNICICCIFLLFMAACSHSNNKSTPEVYENAIKASITTANLPHRVTLNHEATPSSLYEYKWSVRFDANNDLLFGAGDIEFSIAHYKADGATPVTVQVDELQGRLTLYGENGFSSTAEPVVIEVDGNTISFIVERDFISELQGINEMTQIYIEAFKNIPSGRSHDYVPADREFTQLQNISFISDSLGDYSGTDNSFDIVEFSLSIYE